MKSKITKLPKSRVKIELQVSAKEIKPFFDKVYHEFASKIQIEGFRNGHAPKTLVIEQVGFGRLKQETLQKLLNFTYEQSILHHKLIPVSSPSITIDIFELNENGQSNKNFQATVEIDVMPKGELKNYNGIRVKALKFDNLVSENEINEQLQRLQRQGATFSALNGAIKMGDWVQLNINGQLNGVNNEKLTNQNFPFIVGENVFVPGFEENLIGLKKGSKKTFKLKFPDKYRVSDFANQNVDFDIEVIDAKKIILPVLNDQFAKKFGHNNLNDLKSALSQSILEEKKQNHTAQLEARVVESALKYFKTDIPDSLVELELNQMIERLNERVKTSGMSLQIYLEKIKKTLPQLRQEFKPAALKNVQIGLLLRQVVVREKIDQNSENAAREALQKLINHVTR